MNTLIVESYTVVDATWDCTIMVWPDGVWCYEDELEETSQGKSDDYATLRLAHTPGIGQTIEQIVEDHCNYTAMARTAHAPVTGPYTCLLCGVGLEWCRCP